MDVGVVTNKPLCDSPNKTCFVQPLVKHFFVEGVRGLGDDFVNDGSTGCVLPGGSGGQSGKELILVSLTPHTDGRACRRRASLSDFGK